MRVVAGTHEHVQEAEDRLLGTGEDEDVVGVRCGVERRDLGPQERMAGRLGIAQPEVRPGGPHLVVGQVEQLGQRPALHVGRAEQVADGELPAGEVALQGEVGESHGRRMAPRAVGAPCCGAREAPRCARAAPRRVHRLVPPAAAVHSSMLAPAALRRYSGLAGAAAPRACGEAASRRSESTVTVLRRRATAGRRRHGRSPSADALAGAESSVSVAPSGVSEEAEAVDAARDGDAPAERRGRCRARHRAIGARRRAGAGVRRSGQRVRVTFARPGGASGSRPRARAVASARRKPGRT